MEESRLQKLMALGADPPNDLKFIVRDVKGELRRRGLTESQIEGVEISVNIAFRLGEKNAAMKIARGEEV